MEVPSFYIVSESRVDLAHVYSNSSGILAASWEVSRLFLIFWLRVIYHHKRCMDQKFGCCTITTPLSLSHHCSPVLSTEFKWIASWEQGKTALVPLTYRIQGYLYYIYHISCVSYVQLFINKYPLNLRKGECKQQRRRDGDGSVSIFIKFWHLGNTVQQLWVSVSTKHRC